MTNTQRFSDIFYSTHKARSLRGAGLVRVKKPPEAGNKPRRVSPHLRAKSRRKRRLRSETRLRAQAAAK